VLGRVKQQAHEFIYIDTYTGRSSLVRGVRATLFQPEQIAFFKTPDLCQFPVSFGRALMQIKGLENGI
jgi:hypothetical protein